VAEALVNPAGAVLQVQRAVPVLAGLRPGRPRPAIVHLRAPKLACRAVSDAQGFLRASGGKSRLRPLDDFDPHAARRIENRKTHILERTRFANLQTTLHEPRSRVVNVRHAPRNVLDGSIAARRGG